MTLEFHKRLNFESFWVENTNSPDVGSGRGSIGRTFASESRDLQFESSHRYIKFAINCSKIYIWGNFLKKQSRLVDH